MTERERQAKRYAALKRKRGVCAACIHRDPELHHGWAHCRGNFRRQHPNCAEDGKEPRYTLDASVMSGLLDKGDGR